MARRHHIKELKLQTNNFTDFSNVDLLNIKIQLIGYLPQEQKNQWFITKARLVHGDYYDYSKINYINNKTKVEIICPVHGSFWQKADSHLSGSGCEECGKIAIHKKNTKTTKQFIWQAKAIHYGFFDYSKVDYINNSTKVEIECPIHGSFWQTPSGHLKGQGCPNCAGNTQWSTEAWVSKAKEVHGVRYNHSKVNYEGDKTKVEIICPVEGHGSFWQRPLYHLLGGGCSKCNHSVGESNITKILKCEFLTECNFNKHKDLKISKSSYLRFDFYLPNYNLCIEYDGEQHFREKLGWKTKNNFEKIQKYDQIKNQFCLDNDIRLVRIPYWVKLTEELILQQLEEDFTVKMILT